MQPLAGHNRAVASLIRRYQAVIEAAIRRLRLCQPFRTVFGRYPPLSTVTSRHRGGLGEGGLRLGHGGVGLRNAPLQRLDLVLQRRPRRNVQSNKFWFIAAAAPLFCPGPHSPQTTAIGRSGPGHGSGPGDSSGPGRAIWGCKPSWRDERGDGAMKERMAR